jgi:hypothetical protein
MHQCKLIVNIKKQVDLILTSISKVRREYKFDLPKGQLIPKCLFGRIEDTKKDFSKLTDLYLHYQKAQI